MNSSLSPIFICQKQEKAFRSASKCLYRKRKLIDYVEELITLNWDINLTTSKSSPCTADFRSRAELSRTSEDEFLQYVQLYFLWCNRLRRHNLPAKNKVFDNLSEIGYWIMAPSEWGQFRNFVGCPMLPRPNKSVRARIQITFLSLNHHALQKYQCSFCQNEIHFNSTYDRIIPWREQIDLIYPDDHLRVPVD